MNQLFFAQLFHVFYFKPNINCIVLSLSCMVLCGIVTGY